MSSSIYSPYGSTVLTESSPIQTFDEPLTLAEVKAFGKIEDSSAADDALIVSTYIPAARGQAEFLQKRDLAVKQYDRSLDYWPYCGTPRWDQIDLRSPLISVQLISYRDSTGTVTTLTENTDYVVDAAKQPGAVIPIGSWPSFTPWPSSAILIRFTCGIRPSSAFWLDDTGARLKMGMQLLVSGWFNNRIPFVLGGAGVKEYPFAVTSCLTAGCREIVY